MKFSKQTIANFLRYAWLILALAIVLYVISSAIVTTRRLVYNLDFSQKLTPDINGWYPNSRTSFVEEKLLVLAEPLYLKLYSPIDFDHLEVAGGINFTDEKIKLGLKSSDGTWLWQDIKEKDFSLTFDLLKAQVKRNKLELILSIPELSASSTVSLVNNWSLILSR